MLEVQSRHAENGFDLLLVDDLKAGDLFSDQRFKDIVISIQDRYTSAISDIKLEC